MADHVSSLCRSVYYQLRQLRPVVRSITEDAAKMVVQVFVFSRLDYCNSLLCGIAGNPLQNLHSVQIECRCPTDHENWKTGAYHTSSPRAALVTSSTTHWLQASCSCAQGVTRPATSTVPGWRLSALDRHYMTLS